MLLYSFYVFHYMIYTTDNYNTIFVHIKQFIDESIVLIFITFFMHLECETNSNSK